MVIDAWYLIQPTRLWFLVRDFAPKIFCLRYFCRRMKSFGNKWRCISSFYHFKRHISFSYVMLSFLIMYVCLPFVGSISSDLKLYAWFGYCVEVNQMKRSVKKLEKIEGWIVFKGKIRIPLGIVAVNQIRTSFRFFVFPFLIVFSVNS